MISRCLAIIPARGGSQGLPRKNVLPLAGLPLLVHSVRCARSFSADLELVLSTDDPEIAAVGVDAGALVPWLRPAELATGEIPTMPVLQHVLAGMEARTGRRYDTVLLLEPTSPLRLPEDIQRAFEVLAGDAEAHGAVGCSRPSFNPFWAGVVESAGYLSPAFEMGGRFTRRQEVPPFFRVNGAVYLWRTDYLRSAAPAWLDDRHRMVEIPEIRSVSIDDIADLQLAESLLSSGLVRLPWVEGEDDRKRGADGDSGT
jgi:N-acylneuraminate cytidylyltransferase